MAVPNGIDHPPSETQKTQGKPTTSTSPENFDLLAGHFGFLSPAQEQAFVTFKAELKKHNLYSDTPSPSLDDGNLLRFLRARRFDVPAAIKQFSENEAWRKQIHLVELYDDYDITEFEEGKGVNPMWTGRRSRSGHPVYCFRVKDLDKKRMDRYFGSSQAAKNSTVNSTSPSPIVVLFELFTRLVIPLCSRMKDRPNVGTPIVASCNLIDITGVGLMQFIGLRGYLGDSSALATARYPETLGSIFVGHLVLAQNDPAITISQVIGAPSYMELIFSFVRTWFDPITRAKITVLPLDRTQAFLRLSEHIDPDNIPKAYGGNLAWDYGEVPALDEAIKQCLGDGFKGWPEGPARLEGDDIVAVGKSKDGGRRRTVVGHVSTG